MLWVGTFACTSMSFMVGKTVPCTRIQIHESWFYRKSSIWIYFTLIKIVVFVTLLQLCSVRNRRIPFDFTETHDSDFTLRRKEDKEKHEISAPCSQNPSYHHHHHHHPLPLYVPLVKLVHNLILLPAALWVVKDCSSSWKKKKKKKKLEGK